MSSLFGLNKPNTDLRKNVFDLSEKSLFSMSSGMLLPCYVKDMNPGEKAKIQMSALTRTQPLNTAAFVRSRQYFHFFFVPYKQLWSGWDNFIYGVDYKTSSLQYGKRYNKVPRLQLLKALSSLLKDGYIIDRSAHSHRVRRNAAAVGATVPTRKVVGKKDYGSSSNVDEGLGGFRPAIDSRTTIQPNHSDGKDELGFEYYHGMSRLLDMLGYGMLDGGGRMTDFNCSSLADIVRISENPNSAEDLDGLCDQMKTADFSVNPFRLLAYQKIYSDFYKRDDYQSTDPLSFNIDDVDEFIETSITGSPEQRRKAYNRLIGMLRMRYRWLPKDYFTGVVPSELFNVQNAFEFMGSNTSRSFEERGADVIKGAGFDENSGRIDINGGNVSSTVSTKSIRAAFAIEKLLRLTRRAGGHDYISQTAAHYGFEPSKGRGDKVQFLGGYSSSINISEVLTTANTDDGATGMMYGKGIGGLEQGKDIEFTAQEHGVLMCITSVVPDLDYSADGLDRFNAKFERGDYFHPEFQDLGLQPVFGYELKNYWRFNGSSDVKVHRNQVLGFVPMYAEYKTSYDKVHGEFKNGKSLSAWSARHLVGYSDGDNNFDGVRIASLLINPRCLNSLFAVHFDGDEMTDQFMVNAQFVVKMIRPMSITGQNL